MGSWGVEEWGSPEIQTPLWVDEEEKEHERLAAWGQRDVSALGTSGPAGSRGGRLGWGGRTPALGSGGGERTGRGRWGALTAAERKGAHSSPPPPPPPSPRLALSLGL